MWGISTLTDARIFSGGGIPALDPKATVQRDRPQSLEPFEESVDVCDCHVRDVALNTVCEPLQASLAVPDINVAHPTAASGFDKLGGYLGDCSDGEQVNPIRSVEPDGIGKRDFTGGAPSADPFLNSGGERHTKLTGCAFAVTEYVDVATGRLAHSGFAIDKPDGDLLGDHLRLVHAGEAAGAPSPTFLPCEGELIVSVLAIDCVDPDFGRTCSNFHD